MPDSSLYAVVAVGLSTRQKVGLMARAAVAEPSARPDDHALAQAYHYAIPPELAEQLVPGQLLWVPFGSEQRQGVLLGFDDAAPVATVRPLVAIVQAESFLQPYQLDLARWMSHRYAAPLWDTLLLLLPPGVLQGTERVLCRTEREVDEALPRDARRLLAWIEGQGSETTMAQATELLGGTSVARTAVRALLAARLLRDETRVKPPGVRPRTERFVRLCGSESDAMRALRSLGKRSPLADLLDHLADEGGTARADALPEAAIADAEARGWVRRDSGTFLQRLWPDEESRLSDAQQKALSWVDSWPEDEPLTPHAARVAGIAAATIQALAARGYLLVHTQGPDRVVLTLPDYRVAPTTDALRGTELQRAALALMAHIGTELTAAELHEATGLRAAHLSALARVGAIEIERREVLRNPLASRHFPPTTPPPLTVEQHAVWAEVERGLGATTRPGPVYLLHGVTGSGKTEIYLRAVAEVLARGQQAIVLVPEIALTPQTVSRFAGRFGDLIALQHSRLSDGERYDEWRRLRDGRAQIVIGSRAALFAPLPNLGLIVVDEEHEGSYKQGALPGYRFPQYHTRDVAAQLAALTGAAVILGSATPSLESFYRAQEGRYRLLAMEQRVPTVEAQENPLPPVQVVDMRQELREGNSSIFSRVLQEALAETLAAQQQAILFLNRRGVHAFVMCRDCGWVQQCPRCDVPMSAHIGVDYLICHQCSATEAHARACPHCLSPRVKPFGVGTQQVEAAVQHLFPEARLLRWDRDATRGKHAHEQLLTHFASGQADILIGTQMIAKGLDLPLVTLVGIISADTALHLPDFRSGERTFQLMTQVAGRAGRGPLGGRVILQSYTPRHYALQCASRHDYHTFYRHEIAARREHAYPPIAPLVRLVYSDPSPRAAEEQATLMAERLTLRAAQLGLAATEVLGAAPCFFARLRGRYRWQVIIRGAHARDLVRAVSIGFGWEVDVDPMSML